MSLSAEDTSPDAVDGNTATYCPEDNKIRIYCGRLSRESFKTLRRAGYKATPKQDCAFVATWSITAEDLARELIPEWDDIGDEDYSPQERAADRAERFSGYRDKRSAEAHGTADRYDAGPTVFGNQNARRAERQAERHDCLRGRACSQWEKAEYWQHRTAGVISNALHRSSPQVRRGRILEIEKEIRRVESNYTPCPKTAHIMDTDMWDKENPDKQYEKCWCGQGRGGHWVRVDKLERIKAGYARYIEHLNMRLIYENAMLENEGGKASEAEITPGGFINGRQVWKVNKSAVTGRVVSVTFSPTGRPNNIERLGADAYRAPTDEELAAFQEKQAATKAEAKANGTATPPLLNPTPETAQVILDIWNAKAKPENVCSIRYATQAQYSAAASRGEYSNCKTVSITERGLEYYSNYMGIQWNGHRTVFRLRVISSGFDARRSIIILTDKPQKPLPLELLTQIGDNPPEYQEAVASLPKLDEARRGISAAYQMPADVKQLWLVAASWGLTNYASESQFSITEKGRAALANLIAVDGGAVPV